jgi:predicted small metal-binding protein
MKTFACGAVVPGCRAKWVCTSDEDILVEVAQHAASVHGIVDVPADVVAVVRASIVPIFA